MFGCFCHYIASLVPSWFACLVYDMVAVLFAAETFANNGGKKQKPGTVESIKSN